MNMYYFNKNKLNPGLVIYARNLSTQQAEAGGFQVQGQSGLHSKTLSQKINKFKFIYILNLYITY
jgi:hypothetical protein